MKKGLVLLAAASGMVLAGCTSQSADGTISVESSNDACKLSATSAPAGNVTFSVKNTGSQVTEFYILASDGLQVVSEVENIGPGITRELVTQLTQGDYFSSCKPGMKGDGIRAPFKVTASTASPSVNADTAKLLQQATANYVAYVQDQSQQLLVQTEKFATAFAAGDTAQAKALYAQTRMHYERIEPVAESFGDLDPKLDLRETDLEKGQVWTGWHRAEKDLWPPAGYTPMTQAQRQQLADELVADTKQLNTKVQNLTLTPAQLANGAKGLLDEVATSKVTGEAEKWSHTDLYDFQANVEGARIAFRVLEPVVQQKNPQLATQINEKFASLQTLLDKYKTQDGGYVTYDQLTPEQVKELSAAVDALSEPLSKLTTTVVN